MQKLCTAAGLAAVVFTAVDSGEAALVVEVLAVAVCMALAAPGSAAVGYTEEDLGAVGLVEAQVEVAWEEVGSMQETSETAVSVASGVVLAARVSVAQAPGAENSAASVELVRRLAGSILSWASRPMEDFPQRAEWTMDHVIPGALADYLPSMAALSANADLLKDRKGRRPGARVLRAAW